MTKKEALMEAAKELFSQLGYEGTTFKKISDTAGVALGLLSHHYGSKERLFLAAALEVLDKQFEHVCRESSKGKDGQDKIMRYCRAYLDFTANSDNHYRMLPLCTPHRIVQESGRELLNAAHIRFDILLEQLIAEGRADGTIAAGMPSSLASVLTCTLMGIVRMRLLTPFGPAALEKDGLHMIRIILACQRSDLLEADE